MTNSVAWKKELTTNVDDLMTIVACACSINARMQDLYAECHDKRLLKVARDSKEIQETASGLCRRILASAGVRLEEGDG